MSLQSVALAPTHGLLVLGAIADTLLRVRLSVLQDTTNLSFMLSSDDRVIRLDFPVWHLPSVPRNKRKTCSRLAARRGTGHPDGLLRTVPSVWRFSTVLPIPEK